MVTEFNYRLAGREAAHIFVGLRTASREDGLAVAAGLRERGYAALDLTDDEMAKLHVRYMVGGRAAARDERLYRFEFPERPGALMQFLDTLGGRFNISLFHYRNHGADFGRVLCRLRGARRGARRVPGLPRPPGLPVVPGGRQPRLRAVPGRQRRASRATARTSS